MEPVNNLAKEKKWYLKKWAIILWGVIIVTVYVSKIDTERQNAQPQVLDTPKIETVETKSTPPPVSKTTSKPTPTPQPVVPKPETQTDRASMLVIIKTNASTKWGDNYEMVKYEYDNQVEAYDWVMAQTKYPNIMIKAKQKWGNNYEMVKYEYENQVKAYESL